MPDATTQAGAEATAPEAPFSRGRLIAAFVVVAVVLALSAFAIGRFAAPVPRIPSTTSAEAGFARDMQLHHQQAVELSMLVRELTDDADVRLIAYDIALTQAQQAGQMYGWLSSWELPQRGEPTMTWMTRPALDGSIHDMASMGDGSSLKPGDPMPGMATFEEVQQLTASTGVAAERLYLELMIDHHRGGIEMAEAVLERTENPAVIALASSIVAGQTAELDVLERLLAARTS